jgi:hypothetical protein
MRQQRWLELIKDYNIQVHTILARQMWLLMPIDGKQVSILTVNEAWKRT